MPDVYILGGHQTDFARNWSRDGVADPLVEMMREATHGALTDADVDPADIDAVHVANFAGEAFTGQAHLGALVPELCPEWSALPSTRHEAACASGSAAALAAIAAIQAGHAEVVAVIGVEVMRNRPGPQAAEALASATWVGHETWPGPLPWPAQFDQMADEIDRRHGLDTTHLSRIAQINRGNARRNPFAQTREWVSDDAQFRADDETNPVVVGRLRRSDCGLLSDGAAAIVLASGDHVERTGRARSGQISAVAGWGQQTAHISLQQKLRGSQDSDYLFPHVRRTVTQAYERARVHVEDVDLFEVHDCFTVNEYIAISHLGICIPADSHIAIEEGWIEAGGRSPINPSGGLIGAGHPIGATGVRMLLDVHRQITGSAGDMQVDGARTAATLNIGGSCSTAFSFVLKEHS